MAIYTQWRLLKSLDSKHLHMVSHAAGFCVACWASETQHHCSGIPLALSEGMGPEANLSETSRRECKYLSAILAPQPGLLWHCRVCQCSATLRQGRHKNTSQGICEVFEKAFPAHFGISWPHVLNQWRSDSMVSCPPGEPICPANRDPNSQVFPWNCAAWMLPLSAYHLRWNKAWQKKVQTAFFCICCM